MKPRFEIDEEVIITREDHKFKQGKVISCVELYGIYAYDIDLPDNTVISNVFENDLISADPAKRMAPQPILMTIDIEKYIPEDKMKELAEGVFASRIAKRIDDALEARRGSGSMVDLMIHEFTTDYAKRLGAKYENELVDRIKEVIKTDNKSTEEDYDDSFLGSIKNVLWSTTSEWVKEHKEEVMSWIIPELKSYIKELMLDVTSAELSRRFGSIISESFNQVIKDLYEDSLTAGTNGN